MLKRPSPKTERVSLFAVVCGKVLKIYIDIYAIFCYTIRKGVIAMPSIRPISDLRNNANDISDFCRQTREPVFITRNGSGDMVVLNIEEYERQMARIDLYGKLAVAEQEIAAGAQGEDFALTAKQLRERLHGAI